MEPGEAVERRGDRLVIESDPSGEADRLGIGWCGDATQGAGEANFAGVAVHAMAVHLVERGIDMSVAIDVERKLEHVLCRCLHDGSSFAGDDHVPSIDEGCRAPGTDQLRTVLEPAVRKRIPLRDGFPERVPSADLPCIIEVDKRLVQAADWRRRSSSPRTSTQNVSPSDARNARAPTRGRHRRSRERAQNDGFALVREAVIRPTWRTVGSCLRCPQTTPNNAADRVLDRRLDGATEHRERSFGSIAVST